MSGHAESRLPRLIRDFEAASIDAERFDHEAHVRVAWEYLKYVDLPQTLARYSAALRSLTARLGVAEKYHATVTGFLLLEIAERRSFCPDADWQAFVDRNPDLFRDVRRLLVSRYDEKRLDSDLARRQFLLPDRGLASTDRPAR